MAQIIVVVSASERANKTFIDHATVVQATRCCFRRVFSMSAGDEFVLVVSELVVIDMVRKGEKEPKRLARRRNENLTNRKPIKQLANQASVS